MKVIGYSIPACGKKEVMGKYSRLRDALTAEFSDGVYFIEVYAKLDSVVPYISFVHKERS